ncbi:MAG TPA: hypothetical protein VNZ63_10190 [Verrucomicrobiae bacterium]|jgi:hypothetical protein|nr:hypothetical protein [Verrucomicrobiae bacterium]
MPARPRKSNAVAQQIIPLLLLGIGLVSTNNSVTFLNEEATTLGAAVNPLRTLIAQSVHGTAAAGFHPLFDSILHFWLQATGGNFDYLRLPSALFFLAGLLLLGRAARRFTPGGTGLAVIWLGVLWPFSFHFARLATSYSFSFFLVSALTLSYLEYLEDRTRRRGVVSLVFCVALIWTTYWGWAILACLVLDQIARGRAKEATARVNALVLAVVILGLCFVPCFSTLRSSIARMMNLRPGIRAILASAGLNVFSFFVSSSVAPWYWRLSIPVGIVIVVGAVLAARWLPRAARRFLVYAVCVLALMALTGALQAGNLFVLAPWVLLPFGIVIETEKPRWATFALAAALLGIGVAGWYGIYAKRFYSDPQFIEPWQEIAADAAVKIANGATVISDQPAFLFYLTYDLHAPRENRPWRFEGLLPDAVKHPQVFSPEGWLSAQRPANRKIVLVRSAREPGDDAPVDQAARELDASCGSISSRLRVRDEGYAWKHRFLPQLRAPLWRIEIREYDCDSSNSRQIYRIPPQ